MKIAENREGLISAEIIQRKNVNRPADDAVLIVSDFH